MPPQFHQPSRVPFGRRLSARMTSTFGLPGSRPLAGSSKGVYGSLCLPISLPLSQTRAIRRTWLKRTHQPAPSAVCGPVKPTRYQPTVPSKYCSSGWALKTCGTVAACQFEPARPLCQLADSPAWPGSGANCQPWEIAIGAGGSAAGAAAGNASATTIASTESMRRGTSRT